MRIILLSFSLMALVVFNTGCKKEPQLIYEDVNLSIPWIANFPDTVRGVSMTPIVLEDKVIFSATDLNTQREVFALDKATGKVVWRWKDYRHLTDYMPTSDYDKVVYKNLFVFNINGYIYAIDHNTGKTAWVNTEYKYGYNRDLFQFGADIYYEGYKDKFNITNEITRLNLETQKQETLLKLDGKDWGYVSIPIVRVENNTDTMMYFQANNRNENFNAYLMCYNLTARKMKYQKKLTSPFATKTVSGGKIFFYQDKIIIAGATPMSIDANSGQILWSYNLEDNSDPKILTSVSDHPRISKNLMFIPQGSIVNMIELNKGERLTPFKDEVDEYALLEDKIIHFRPRKLGETLNIRSILSVRKQDGTFLFELTEGNLSQNKIKAPEFVVGGVDTKERDVYLVEVDRVYKVSLK